MVLWFRVNYYQLASICSATIRVRVRVRIVPVDRLPQSARARIRVRLLGGRSINRLLPLTATGLGLGLMVRIVPVKTFGSTGPFQIMDDQIPSYPNVIFDPFFLKNGPILVKICQIFFSCFFISVWSQESVIIFFKNARLKGAIKTFKKNWNLAPRPRF